MAAGDFEAAVRLRAFQFLDEQKARFGGALPRQVLAKGFEFEGTRIPLLNPQGIFKPRVFERMPLSITTVPIVEGKPRPYEDHARADGLIGYKYRGTDPFHRDNVGLREAMNNKAPLVYFYGLTPGVYEATYPVFIVGEEAAEHTFVVAIDDARMTDQETPEFGVAENSESTRRRYITSSVQRRLHQRAFSFRVLRAYHHSCAMCRLRREALVDAAHILPDKHPKGEPWVSNGLALCKLHHAAFDEDLLGVRPDLVIEVRSDVLKEKDGPMLMHGLQEMHNRPLVVLPSAKNERPRAEFLEERYHRFRSTA